jgi:(1->4)-alpha-D-glucan 1-alpha-D-glucosylmutase
LRDAVREVIVAFPVYRTYVTEESDAVPEAEAQYIREAVRAAKGNKSHLDGCGFDFLEDLLLLHLPEAGRKDIREWVMKFQQLTGPVMAKGLEDTACYTYNRLISLNEVGGNPGVFGILLEEFHQSVVRSARWPHSLLATATHDTKRGEDARARINVLSEMPKPWRQAVLRWQRLNADNKTPVDGQPAPSPNDEYLLYQTLVGAWLPETDHDTGLAELRTRLTAYMLKAVREAKIHTAWTEPNVAYEEATRLFTERLLDEAVSHSFLEDFRSFHRKVAFFGRFNSLSQVLLKMTAPGIPDFYQGTELWDFNLVDPDNRRPVDYAVRVRRLADIKAKLESPGLPALLNQLLQEAPNGQIKLYLIWRTLGFRRQRRGLFDGGSYVPLSAEGAKKDHVVAFARVRGNQAAVVVAPRLPFGLAEEKEVDPMGEAIWQDTRIPLPPALPAGAYRNVLTGETLLVSGEKRELRLSRALRLFPAALLENDREPPPCWD